jgi:hypothetical protein
VVPVIGAAGPVTSTNPSSKLRITTGVGAGSVLLVFRQNEIELHDFLFPGITMYVATPTVVGPLVLNFLPGQPGVGSLSLLLPQSSALTGSQFVFQAFMVDPLSPTGVSTSNGLQLTFGL